ncbi:hypothetical protein QQP08_015949 [Theobroma cacao]|nr:hypothetical protein QQP08_015949 [Theobroma cacao]
MFQWFGEDITRGLVPAEIRNLLMKTSNTSTRSVQNIHSAHNPSKGSAHNIHENPLSSIYK